MEKKSGIVSFTGTFRESVADIKECSKVIFIGTVLCMPFIELLAYTVRDKGFDMIYVPKAATKEARKIREMEGRDYSVVSEKGNPKSPDVVVLLGGLAIPKFGCLAEDVNLMIEDIAGGKKPKIIGVCFMNMLERAGWDKKIAFDARIDLPRSVFINKLLHGIWRLAYFGSASVYAERK